MGLTKMNRTEKILLSFSCFLPLFPVFFLKNCVGVCLNYTMFVGQMSWEVFAKQKCEFWFNAVLCVIWITLTLVASIGVWRFRKTFLDSKTRAKESIILIKASNITENYFFTYFSVFVISFFAVDPTKGEDTVVLAFFIILMVVVYVRNDMFFINPVLNIIGYKSFSISYRKFLEGEQQNSENAELYEIRVFSKAHLNQNIRTKAFISFSPHDFSVCYPDEDM